METFELYLSPRNEKQFKAIVTQSGEADSSLPFTDSENDWRMTLLRTLEIAGFNPQYFSSHEQEWMRSVGILAEDRKDFDTNYLVYIGQALYRSLLPEGKVENAFKAAVRLAESKNTQLHIQLRFEDDSSKRSRLADYPWELLHDGQDFLLHHQVTFSRYIAHDALPPNLSTFERLNVLLVSSAAFDKELGLQKLSKKEQQAIYKGLESAHDAGHINLDELEYATVDELRKYFTEHQGKDAPHVVHFDGHGIFAKRCKNENCRTIHKRISATHCNKCNSELPKAQGYLAFESEGDKPDYVSAKELGALLQQTSFADGSQKPGGVALVVLSACQSAMALEGESVFNGAAQNLINHRIPAVVAMQYSVGVDAATEFAKQFYRSLGQKNSLAVAISQGREAMGVEGNQWYRPVLYLRWKDNQGGQLFAPPLSTVRIGIPFQAPPLPTYYVDRPEYSQDLKNRLLTKSSDVRTLVVTAIHGLGAVGKSTIATALAHDEEVQNHFCDGILWVTLGQQPNLLSLLSGWVQALGDYNFKATSVEATCTQLRTLLYDKAVLLVVDDAWNTSDAQAFNVGGARCQVLVTTREAEIAQVFGASTYSLDVMTPSQGIELLTKKLGRKLTDAETTDAEALAKEVGYLPLALELAAAQVDDGISWAVLLRDMQQEVARLKTLDNKSARDAKDEASLKRLSLIASLNLSVKRLSEETRENFIWLGILPEDVNIAPKMTATLWDIDDERDAEDELRYFKNKALLLAGVPLPDGTPTYRLHDLFHDLACNLLTASPKPKRKGNLPGLGITLPKAHASFLEKYRSFTDKNLWHTLPSDGYIHQHLVWHLEKAEQVKEIHQLLAEESATGRNGWYEACEHLGQTANFVTDVARAWQLAEESWDETKPEVIGLQCRYALIIASLNSLAANLPIQLLIALIQKNLWTPEQGIAYVLQSSNPIKKANLLTKLANHLPANLKELALSKALTAAMEIQDEKERGLALSSLAKELPELLPEALAAARKIQNDWGRASALSKLAKELPELLPEALTAARNIKSGIPGFKRALALSSLAPVLPPELLPEALAAARKIQYDYGRALVLSKLAKELPELLPEALAAARQIEYDGVFGRRAEALSRFVKELPELLPEALAAAMKIRDESNRASALSSLAPVLPPELFPEAWAAARKIQNDWGRVCALGQFAPVLPSELLPEALAAARQIQDESSRASALNNLAPVLPSELLPEALADARKIRDESNHVKALSSLAKELPELLPEALAAARQIQDESSRASALSNLAPVLPSKLLPEALATARQIQDESSRASALSSLAKELPELLPEALVAARQIQNVSNRVHALSSLAPVLPPELLPEALAAAKQIPGESNRAYVLSNLAPVLPPELLPEALAAARQISGGSNRAYVLSNLAPVLPSELLPEALATAREIQDELNRDKALINLAKEMPELLPEALAAARQIQDESNRASALMNLAKKQPELLPEALAAARQIQDESNRASALKNLAPKLLPEALAAARQIQDELKRASALSNLAPVLPPKLLPEALAAARQIQDEFNRASALSSLTPVLPSRLLPEVLAAARQIRSESWGNRAIVLSSLAKELPELLPEALVAARQIESESNRAKVLISLAKELSQIQKNQLFSLWRDTLHVLSLRTRLNLLTDIEALTPVMFTLGGQQAVKNTATAIQDVSRWWG
ncbi:MAG: CHAT domain-containing protein [Cyanobacteria bacterium P01_C01_bin.38]